MNKANKNQHYVPVFYFKQFSENKKTIGMFLKKDGVTKTNVSINDQCSQTYFYGDSTFEQLVGKFEAKISALFAEIIKKERIPVRSEDILLLCLAVTLQYYRTLKLRMNFPGNAVFKDTVESLFHTIAKRDLESGEYRFLTQEIIDSVQVKIDERAIHLHHLIESVLGGATLFDLTCCLLINETTREFVFSDSPVVYFNQALSIKTGNIGNLARGLQIFYPLSPRLTVLLYDAPCYEVKQKDGVVFLSQKNDIEKINGLQMHNAYETLYFSDQQQAILVQNLWKKEKGRFNEPSSFQEFPKRSAAGEITEKYVLYSHSAFQYPLHLSFMKQKRIRVPKLYNPIDYVRNYHFGKSYISAMEALKKNLQIFKDECPEYFGLDLIEHELFIRALYILFA